MANSSSITTEVSTDALFVTTPKESKNSFRSNPHCLEITQIVAFENLAKLGHFWHF